jgi:hypothetical protein
MIKKLLVLFLVVVISFSFVYAVEILDKNIGNYMFIGTETKIYNSTAPQTHITYKDKNNATCKVIIEEYSLNDSDTFSFEVENHLLDIWVKQSNGSLRYGNNTVFLGENNKEVFWAHENFIITVKAKQPKFKSSDEYVQFIESNSLGEFDSNIINAYLKIYPSKCNASSCQIKGIGISETKQKLIQMEDTVNRELMIERNLIRERNQPVLITPEEIRVNNTENMQFPEEESVVEANTPNIVTMKYATRNNDSDVDEPTKGKENLFNTLVAWIKNRFPGFLH